MAFQIPAARRGRGDRAQHRRGDQGPGCAEDRLGRWGQRQIRLRRLPGRTRGGRTEARTGGTQGGRRRSRLEGRRQSDRRRVLSAASRPCRHGAAGCRRGRQGRQGGDLGAGAKRRRNARGRRQIAWHSPGECHRQRDPARRRLRAQVEMRLRHRSGPALKGTRRPREGAVDAGRRRPQWLPAHRLGGAHRGRPRQERQGDGLAASQRRAEHRLDICRRCAASGAVRTRHGAGRHALRDRQRPVRESGSGRACPHRLVPLGIEYPARLRSAVHGRPNSPMPPTAIKRTCCWN